MDDQRKNNTDPALTSKKKKKDHPQPLYTDNIFTYNMENQNRLIKRRNLLYATEFSGRRKKKCHSVALCGWAAKADDSFVCFGAKPDKGFLDMKSRRIRKWEGDANESWLGKELRGSWRLDGRATGQQRVGVGTAKRVGVEPRTGAVNTGLRRK